MNLVFIMTDTFRYDHLGCNGNREIRTPHLDRLSKRSIIFDRCYANSFPTMPCRADLATGKYTYGFMGWGPLPPGETTLAELLSENGYLTTAVVDTPFYIKEAYNYDRGFQDFIYVRGQNYKRPEGHDVRPYRTHETDYAAPATLFTAERWLQRHYKEKFFLYIDTWDPHEPWDPPAWFVEPYLAGYDGRDVPPCYGKYKERGVSEEDLRVAHSCYCGEVSMVDRWIGRLLDTIEALNLMEDTAIIFTTDHGFYFGEHGYFGKSVMDREAGTYGPAEVKDMKLYRSPLYEEVTHVPLMVYYPGFRARRTDALVSIADLMPLMLDFARIEAPNFVQSLSLMPILEDEDDGGKDFVVTSWPLYNPGEVTRAVDAFERNVQEPLPSSITTKEWVLIYAAEGHTSELYNLNSDPDQNENVIKEQPETAEQLHSKFLSHLRENGTADRLLDPRKKL